MQGHLPLVRVNWFPQPRVPALAGRTATAQAPCAVHLRAPARLPRVLPLRASIVFMFLLAGLGLAKFQPTPQGMPGMNLQGGPLLVLLA
jgi:hypothetical protein